MARPRARLDHAAIARAFAPDGLHGVTSAEIARRAGVAKPTIYAHGRSKEQVFLACVEAEVERLLSALSAADVETRSLPARQRLSGLASAVIEHARTDPEAARLLHLTARHTASGVARDVDGALARVPAQIARALRHDTTPACANRVAVALLGAAAALGLARSPGAEEGAALVGHAFATVLEPIGEERAGERVQTVGLY